MRIEHKNPKEPKYWKKRVPVWARAPYNFVPLPERIVTVEAIPPLDRYSGHSGTIICHLTTVSPLYVRTRMTPEFFKQYGDKAFYQLPPEQKEEMARFFEFEHDQPVIPGSSLRGMVRGLVEIAAFAKMRWVTSEPLVFRAVGDTTSLGIYYRDRLMPDEGNKQYTPVMRAGYMEHTGVDWRIRPAQQIGGVTFARIDRFNDIPDFLPRWPDHVTPCVNAYRIWVRVGPNVFQDVRGGSLKVKYARVLDASDQPATGFQEGVLAYSGPMDKKRHEAVLFPPDPDARTIQIDDDLVRRYREQVSQEQQNLLGDTGALRERQPVFYLLDEKGELVFFGHVWLFRLPYERSPLDFVPAAMRGNDAVDLAEAIFGFVAESATDKRPPHAGRVSFGDAKMDPEQTAPWLVNRSITPRILAAPKPTTFQHYLTQQEPDLVETGKYDRNGNPKKESRLDHYASPPPHETAVRGHKLYWHRGNVGLDVIEEQDTNKIAKAHKQYTRMRPLRSGVTFTFDIHFENLQDFELGALLWALTLPGEPGRVYRHKVGMGKPLGLGSVALRADLKLHDRVSPPSDGHDNMPDDDSTAKGGRYACLFTGDRWHYGDAISVDPAPLIAQFEQYVLSRLHPSERKQATSLSQVRRIEMLLRLLEWREATSEWLDKTRYMEIEHGSQKINEYKERPVLPDPLAVLAGQPVQPPTPVHQTMGQPSPKSPQSAPPTGSVSKTPSSQPNVPPTPPKTQPIREATVVSPEGSFVTVELDGAQINIQLNDLVEPGRDLRDRQRLYPKGSKIRVRDLGLSSKGKRRLTTKL